MTCQSTRTPCGTRALWAQVAGYIHIRLLMRFTELPKLEHELVILRPLTAADILPWYEYLTLPVVFEHTSWNVSAPSELEHYAAQTELPSSLLRLAIAERASGQLVGTIGFHTVSPENRSAELAYDLSPPWWGKGIASHACEVMVQWAHSHVGLLRVQATVLTSNSRSIEVLQRCGFKREGLLRSYRIVRGRPGDFWMYSHVRDAT
ncbi:MAG: putative ribosomal-protein-alanine N-acetyltransferase [Ramlibacter sp.]|nr:putative ribosomal-protein-alanine N-acetyltransferase [Ramlibacter sp.]